MDQDVKDARAKLAARFGNTQIGGKGKSCHTAKSLGLVSRNKHVTDRIMSRNPKKNEESRARQGRGERRQEAEVSTEEVR